MAKTGCPSGQKGLTEWAVIGLASVIGLHAASGMALADDHDTDKDKSRNHQKSPDTAPIQRDYLVMLAELAAKRDDQALAARAYVKALEQTRDVDLAQRATRTALAARHYGLAYRAARIWAEQAQDNAQAQQTALRLAFLANDDKLTRRLAPRLLAAVKSKKEGYERLTQSLGGRPKQAALALDVMSRQVSEDAQALQAQRAMARLALAYGQLDQASEAVDAIDDIKPDWAETRMLRASIAIKQGHPGQAVAEVNAIRASAGERAEYQIRLGRMLTREGHDRQALAVFKHAVSIDGDNLEARYQLGIAAMAQDELDIAAVQFEMLYNAESRRDSAAFHLGQIARRQNHADKASHWFGKVEGGRHILDAGVQMAQLQYAQGDRDEALERLAELSRQYPQKAAKLAEIRSVLLLQNDQPDKALAILDKALESKTHEKQLRYNRALAYERLDRIDKARRDLEAILEQDGDNAEALNALGYMLTNHSDDYDKAEHYIRKALKQAPDTPAILDSLGWVTYKRGDLKQARDYLSRAHDQQPDPEISAHLGEVLWEMGDRGAARKIWEKACSDFPGNKLLQQTMERLDSSTTPS